MTTLSTTDLIAHLRATTAKDDAAHLAEQLGAS